MFWSLNFQRDIDVVVLKSFASYDFSTAVFRRDVEGGGGRRLGKMATFPYTRAEKGEFRYWTTVFRLPILSLSEAI